MRQPVRLVVVVSLVGLVMSVGGWVGLGDQRGAKRGRAGDAERWGEGREGQNRGDVFAVEDLGRCSWMRVGTEPFSEHTLPIIRPVTPTVRSNSYLPFQQIDSFPSPDTFPWGLGWDGTHLWHSDLWARAIYQLDPSNGTVVSWFPAPDDWTKDLAFDGIYLWACGNFNSRVYKLNTATGGVVFSFASPGVNPLGLAWDGAYLWHSAHPGTNTEPTRVFKIDPSDGQVVALFPLPFQWANGLAWDSGFLWVSDSDHGVLYKMDPVSGSIVDACGAPGAGPLGLTCDGTNVWSTDRYTDYIYKFRPDSALPAIVLDLPEASTTHPTWRPVLVFGTVTGPNLVSWAAQYGRGESPSTWDLVDSVHHSPVVQDTLGIWDVSGIEQDFYNVRIRAEFTGGVVDTNEVVKIYVDPYISQGWPKCYPNISPVAFGDLDGDHEVEVVAGIEHNDYWNARVMVWDVAGVELWQGPFAVVNSHTPVALGNADNAGPWEIATGYPPSSPGDSSVPVYLITYLQGICPNWPQYGKWETGFWAYMIPVFEDIDGDNDLETMIGGRRLYGWHHTGDSISSWPLDIVASDPAVGDLDGDSLLDFVFKNGDNLEVRDREGNSLPGFPFSLPSPGRWTYPVLGDIDEDGATEIVFALENTQLFAVDDGGSTLPGWPQVLGGGYTNSPVLGDLDGDGDLEIVAVSGFFPTYSVVHVFNHDGSTYPGAWPITLDGRVFRAFNAPALADVDGDGAPDIVMGFEVEPEFEEFFAWHRNGAVLSGWPRRLSAIDGYGITGSPMVGDMNNDGLVDVAISSNAYWIADTEVYTWSLPFAYDASTMEWPTYRHDLYRTANYHFGRTTGVEERSGSANCRRGTRLTVLPSIGDGPVEIAYYVPSEGRGTRASLAIYDPAGKLVRRFADLTPGWGRVGWNFLSAEGGTLSQGVYLVILKAPPFQERAKLIHLRKN